MTSFLVVARRTEIRAISLDVDYFADVIIPLGKHGNAVAVDVDLVESRNLTDVYEWLLIFFYFFFVRKRKFTGVTQCMKKS